MRRVFHGVQVIQVAEEFVEAVDGGQKLVAIAQMVLAELAGGVALRLERGGNRAGFGRHADLGARLADRGHAGADGQFADDEVRATRRAACLGVVVGEQHAFLGQLVEVRRPPGHHAAMVGADVPHADVIAHDDEDVRLFARGGLLLHRGIVGQGHQLASGRAERATRAGGSLVGMARRYDRRSLRGSLLRCDRRECGAGRFFGHALLRRPGVGVAEDVKPG